MPDSPYCTTAVSAHDKARLLEICIDDIEGLDAAIAGGADRVELCTALAVGGLSPAPALIKAAAASAVPAHMLVRPRDGGFCYTAREASMIASDIDAGIQAGLAGVVIGALTVDDVLDEPLLKALIDHARGQGALSITLHRAFDICRDMAATLEIAVSLGFDHILTSGGSVDAVSGLTTIAALHRQAAGRIGIIAASGISAQTVSPILAAGIQEIHASCSRQNQVGDIAERRLGFVGNTHRRTDAHLVRELRHALDMFDRD